MYCTGELVRASAADPYLHCNHQQLNKLPGERLLNQPLELTTHNRIPMVGNHYTLTNLSNGTTPEEGVDWSSWGEVTF